MSRGTGECMAEIVFSCSRGIYRCTWYQHRARKKPGGNLAEAVHEISDYASGASHRDEEVESEGGDHR